VVWVTERLDDPGVLPEQGLDANAVYSLGSATVRVYPKGHSRRAILLDLVQSMRPQVLELGLASGAELDELDAARPGRTSMTRTRW
jgi:hypothetical protein